MSYKKEILQNSPGFFDADDRKIIMDNSMLFFGFEVISTPDEDYDIDLRRKDDLTVGIEGERPRFECGYDWWDENNLHYSMKSGFPFKTINIAERKHHYWEEYEKKYNNNRTTTKTYFI